ncbi:MAG: hypothetical protein JKY95_06085 [Planctomycetaceae bacterium]|nr:hypothetical protein [Planctomycetaceae bacterium]
MGTIESIGHTFYPPPADLDMSNAEQMKKHVANLPVAAMLFVIVGWAAGIFTGCLIGGIMGIRKGRFCCLVFGLLFTLMVILMLVKIPSPIWFSIAGIVVLAPSAFLGWSISRMILIRLKSIPGPDDHVLTDLNAE